MSQHDTPEAVRLADSIKASGQFTPLDELDAAAAILRRIPELETELEAAKLGEAFHDKQANEYARQVAHWIGKFDEVKVERDQLRAELEKVRVPDGWKLVPEQMTDAMRDAGNEWICNRYLLQRAWHSAVTAAPTPPNADQKGQ